MLSTSQIEDRLFGIPVRGGISPWASASLRHRGQFLYRLVLSSYLHGLLGNQLTTIKLHSFYMNYVYKNTKAQNRSNLFVT